MRPSDIKTPVQIFAAQYNKYGDTSAKRFIVLNGYLYHQIIMPAMMEVQAQEIRIARFNEERRVKCVGCIATDRDIMFDEVQRVLRTPNPAKALQELEERELREYKELKAKRAELFQTLLKERAIKRKK